MSTDLDNIAYSIYIKEMDDKKVPGVNQIRYGIQPFLKYKHAFKDYYRKSNIILRKRKIDNIKNGI